MKCKVINTVKGNLEREINIWLDSKSIEIFSTSQTQDDEYITFTILYYDLTELRARKLDKLNNYDAPN